VTAGINAPAVQIVSTSGGAAQIGDTITLEWEATDPDPQDRNRLAFDVQYSANDGATWDMIEQNLGGCSTETSPAAASTFRPATCPAAPARCSGCL